LGSLIIWEHRRFMGGRFNVLSYVLLTYLVIVELRLGFMVVGSGFLSKQQVLIEILILHSLLFSLGVVLISRWDLKLALANSILLLRITKDSSYVKTTVSNLINA
jgi:hypothetical protein